MLAPLAMSLIPKRPLHLPRLRTYVPEPSDPKIFWFNSERADILQDLVRRIMERYEADVEPFKKAYYVCQQLLDTGAAKIGEDGNFTLI